MKTFYLRRTEDVHGISGVGVVAEGVIFDNGMVAMTWLSEHPTLTMFPKVSDVVRIHGHERRTTIVIEGRKKDAAHLEECREIVRTKRKESKRIVE